ALFAHPGRVLLRIQDPKSKISRFRREADARFALAQDFLLSLPLNSNPRDMRGDLGQPRLLWPRAPFFLAIHRKRTQNVTLSGENWCRPTGAKSANPRQLAVISPKRVRHYIGHDDRSSPVHRSTAGTITRADRSAVHRFHISLWQIRCRAMTHMFAVSIQKENRTTQSFRLTFHEKNKACQNIRQWRVGSDHLKYPALADPEKFFLFNFSDVAANDHAA